MNQMKNWIEAVGKVLQKWFAAERKVTKTVETDVCKKNKNVNRRGKRHCRKQRKPCWQWKLFWTGNMISVITG